ncbi:MAG TPA: alpha/beta hydrolase [Burkholderiaceae bacterium]|nr:alpha/beta hydrolase [Burkholderiaceae bacterium]
MASHAQILPTFSAPPLALLATEPLRGMLDHVAGLFLDVDGLPRGDGRPVIVYPGLGATAHATARLRSTLDRLGWSTHDWGLGLNRGPRGDFDAWIDGLAERVDRIADEAGRAPSLVGWSLGGVFAREIARRRRGAVDRVITLGSPVRGGPESTRAGPLYRVLSGTPARLDAAMRARLERALPVPHVSIWSRTDGVVAWRSCRVDCRHGVDVEVPGVSHMGLVAHPKALREVARVMALPVERLAADGSAARRTDAARARAPARADRSSR